MMAHTVETVLHVVNVLGQTCVANDEVVSVLYAAAA